MPAKRQACDADAREYFGDHIGIYQIKRAERARDNDTLQIGAWNAGQIAHIVAKSACFCAVAFIKPDHTRMDRIIAAQAQKRKQKAATSWRMDETYIKMKGKWTYYYRAVDKFGKTLDFMLSAKRDEAAATAFFARKIGNNGFPDKVVIDKSGANLAGLENMNCLLMLNG